MTIAAKSGNRIEVAHNVILDRRLALFHECQGWLAVADLHFGYELSQRAAMGRGHGMATRSPKPHLALFATAYSAVGL
jgi:hypothetical protein